MSRVNFFKRIRSLFSHGQASTRPVPESVQERTIEPVRDIGVTEYRAITSALQPPSDEQIIAFAEYVSDAHSWYKHLPLLPPGKPFVFFMDCLVGYDRVCLPSGEVVHTVRTKDSPRFHYTWMTTAEYRRRFGYLAYSCEAGQRFIVSGSGNQTDYHDRRQILCDTDGYRYRIPASVERESTVELTGVIHPETPCIWVWGEHLRCNKTNADWPKETGGADTLDKIRAYCRDRQELLTRSPDQYHSIMDEVDPKLEAMLAPERDRLKKTMIEAMRRMRKIVCG